MPPAPLITHAEIIAARVALDVNPAGELALADLTITVTFRPTAFDNPSRADSAGADCRAWVGRYLTDRDLARALDFAPTTRNLAVYLLHAFEQLSPEVHTVTVELDGQTRTTAAAD